MGKVELGMRNVEGGKIASCRGQNAKRFNWARGRWKKLKVGGWEGENISA